MYVKCSEDSERKKRKSPFPTTTLSFDAMTSPPQGTPVTGLQIFIQLSATLTKLCHIKRDHHNVNVHHRPKRTLGGRS